MNRDNTITAPDDLTRLVRQYGFLPFFSSCIPGFSIDDMTPSSVWQQYLGLGPWLWRDDIAAEKQCIYGKFFGKKTGYVSADWFAHLCNYRRDGYDFEGWYEDGHAHYAAKQIYDIVEQEGPVSAPLLRSKAHIPAAAFERELTNLQMQTFIVPSDFRFPRDQQGNKKYSYGTTIYDLPERWLGEDVCTVPEGITPEDSFRQMADHLADCLPGAARGLIEKMLR